MKNRVLITSLLLILSLVLFSSCENKVEKPNETIKHENIIYKVLDRESVAVSSVEDISKANWDCIIPETVGSYTVKVIGANAFSNCTGLLTLELPKSITKIGENIVRGSESLEKITILSDSFTILYTTQLIGDETTIKGRRHHD